MIKFKKLVLFILIPLIFGGVGTLLGNYTQFEEVVKPSFQPPSIVFPIVWGILYILMGISSYLVSESNCECKKAAIYVYIIQLAINSLWNLFFFNLKLFLFSFILVIVLIILCICMIYLFRKCNKLAGNLQIPYLIWLIFASVLTFSVYLLN